MNSLLQEKQKLKDARKKGSWLFAQGFMTERAYHNMIKRIEEQTAILNFLIELTESEIEENDT